MGKRIYLKKIVFCFFFLLATGVPLASSMEVKISDKPLAPATGGEYVGSESCKDCHPEHYRKWFLSPHASAYNTLKKSPMTPDSRCLRCHTTGFGVRSGFGDNPALTGVHCEACHGPSSRHVNSASGSSPKHTPGLPPDCADCEIRKICMPCHIPKESPDFDFNLYYDRVKHK